MNQRYSIVVIDHTDPAAPRVELDFPNRDAARAYLHDNADTALREGLELRMCSTPVRPVLPEGAVVTLCPRCHGAGSITTRVADVGGAFFPDEDDCPRCHGAGKTAVRPLDISPARAS